MIFKKRNFSALAIILIIVFINQKTLAETLTIITENYAPFNYCIKGKNFKGTYNECKITGFSTEIVRRICKELNIKDDFKMLPWNRAYNFLQTKKNHALFSMYRTDEREVLFKWVGPLVGVDQCLWALKNKNIKINSLEEAKTVGTILTQENSNVHLFLVAKGFKNLMPSASGHVSKMFAAGRGDLYPASIISGVRKFRKMKIIEQVEPVFTLKKDYLYIAFNKETSDHIIQAWQKALDKIKVEPFFNEMETKFLAPYYQ